MLQAAALAAAGNFRADDLVKDIRASLPDKRQERMVQFKVGMKAGSPLRRKHYAEVDISADFSFGPRGSASAAAHPFHGGEGPLGANEVLRSRIRISPDRAVAGNAGYFETTGDTADPTAGRDKSGDRDTDPLVAAREDDLPHWFVVGYGVQRDLPEDALTVTRPERASIDRLKALFGPHQLIGLNFQALFNGEMAKMYTELLRDVLMHTGQLMPGVEDIELRERGGVTTSEDLTQGHRVAQRVRDEAPLKLPARWLPRLPILARVGRRPRRAGDAGEC